MEGPSLTKIMAVYAVVFLVIGSIGWFPRSWWARTLRSQHGPATNPDRMTRAEVWRSAGGFLLIGIISLLISFGAIAITEWLYGRGSQGPLLFAVSFMAFLGALMGFGGAIYMAIRAPFRPPYLYRWRDDPLSRAEEVKQYRTSDGKGVAVIYAHPDGVFEVVTLVPLPKGVVAGLAPRAFAKGLLVTAGRTTDLGEAEQMALRVTGQLPAPSGEVRGPDPGD